ncbi:DUF6985 domain-containing protein [Corynebacterium nuruki]|uniref:DUF6985 domain-containing protein n=1 Tax=Corynebacterium nuruki TaxID=1032851 RepID=UPI00024857DB|nr:hypothetical protein [Corynebacterium nuruki]
MTDKATLPGIGDLHEGEFNLETGPLSVGILDSDVSFGLEGWTPVDADPAEVDAVVTTVTNFRAATQEVLDAASVALFAYYTDTVKSLADEDPGYLEDIAEIGSADEVWNHVTLGEMPVVAEEDGTWYVSLESECGWAEEDGLQIVFRNGNEITKVGPFDDMLTWSDDEEDASGDGIYRTF